MAGCLIDTNVLLRLMQEESDDYQLVFAAIDKLGMQGDVLFITPQVIIEFWSVSTRPVEVNGLGWDTKLAAARISEAMREFPLLDDSPAIVHLWLDLVRTHDIKGKKTHDARLIAVMQAHGVESILTFNVDDFKGFEGINVMHPSDA